MVKRLVLYHSLIFGKNGFHYSSESHPKKYFKNHENSFKACTFYRALQCASKYSSSILSSPCNSFLKYKAWNHILRKTWSKKNTFLFYLFFYGTAKLISTKTYFDWSILFCSDVAEVQYNSSTRKKLSTFRKSFSPTEFEKRKQCLSPHDTEWFIRWSLVFWTRLQNFFKQETNNTGGVS